MKEIILISIVTIFYCCNRPFISSDGSDYLNDSTLSLKNGVIKDSSRYFLPANLFTNSYWDQKQIIDSFKLEWFSGSLLCFREPVLYNYYLGTEAYRFLWLRTFNRSVLITINKSKKVSIRAKISESQPRTLTVIFSKGEWIARTHEKDIIKLKMEYPNSDSIIVPRYNDRLFLDTTYYISMKQWDRFKHLLDSCNFWKSKPTENKIGLDGAEWLLEGQSQNKYHFVNRWSPNDSFERCCEYLIRLSAAKTEEIY
jgi:hypothetical protein